MLLQALFRLNFLAALLCFTMARNYLDYYFIPLVTFWHVTISLALFIPLRSDKIDKSVVVILKMVVVAVLAHLLGQNEVGFSSTRWVRSD